MHWIWGQVLYDENHSLGRREYIETELPLAKLEPRSALGMNISQRIPGQVVMRRLNLIRSAWPGQVIVRSLKL